MAQASNGETLFVPFHEERRWDEERSFLYNAAQRWRHLIVLTGSQQQPDDAAAFRIAHGRAPRIEAVVSAGPISVEARSVRAPLGEVARQTFRSLSVLVVVHPSGIDPLRHGRALAIHA